MGSWLALRLDENGKDHIGILHLFVIFISKLVVKHMVFIILLTHQGYLKIFTIF